MKKTILALFVLAIGLNASSKMQFQHQLKQNDPADGPLSRVERIDGAFTGKIQNENSFFAKLPFADSETLAVDPKVLTYLSPDVPYYNLTRLSLSDRNGGVDIMSGYSADLLNRFKGNRITTINVIFDPELAAASVFIKDANFETIFEQEVDLAVLEPIEIKFNDVYSDTWGAYATVPVDYEITDEIFYVGYHIEVSEESQWGFFDMLCQMNTNHELSWITNYNDGRGYIYGTGMTPCIWCDTEGNGGLALYDAAISGVVGGRTLCGADYDVNATITNLGSQPITSLTIAYSSPDGGMVEETIASNRPLPYMSNVQLIIPIKVNETPGFYEKEIKIVSVNNEPDAFGSDNNAYFELMAIDNPANRRILLEDYTGTWCGYCTRGMAGYELLNTMFPNNVITTEFHVYDEISVFIDGYDEMEYWVNGYPNSIVNHVMAADPWSGVDYDAFFGMGDLVEEFLSHPVEVSIDALAIYEPETNEISVNSELITSMDIPDGSIYEIGFTVTEDGYVGIQSNQYSYEYNYWPKEELPEEMWPYYDLPSLFECTYENVIRNGYGVLGNPGSVASTPIVAYQPVYYEATFESENIADIERVNVVAYVMDSETKEVLNAVKTPLQISTGINTTSVLCSVKRSAEGIIVNTDGEFEINIYTIDGKKVISTSGYGSVSVPIPSQGIYLISVNTPFGNKILKTVI